MTVLELIEILKQCESSATVVIQEDTKLMRSIWEVYVLNGDGAQAGVVVVIQPDLSMQGMVLKS